VTGGAGYVGSHTCKALALAGYTPVAYDNLVKGHEWAVRWGPLERGNINHADRLREVVKAHSPVAVLHFAGYAYVGESVLDPARYYRNNVEGTLVLLDVLREFDIDKFVFSSSCSTYGVPARTPIDEEQPQHPVSPYGQSKLIIERVLRDYDIAYKLKSVSLRYFNAAGADPDLEIGEDHNPETHLIPLVLQAAKDPSQHIIVHGNDYPTPDGTCIRDYIHVNDLAIAHVMALNYLMRGGVACQMNLGTGQGTSVKEVIDIARAVSGREIVVRYGPRRSGDPPVLVADVQRAKTILDWSPQFPKTADQIAHAWAWLNKV